MNTNKAIVNIIIAITLAFTICFSVDRICCYLEATTFVEAEIERAKRTDYNYWRGRVDAVKEE